MNLDTLVSFENNQAMSVFLMISRDLHNHHLLYINHLLIYWYKTLTIVKLNKQNQIPQ